MRWTKACAVTSLAVAAVAIVYLGFIFVESRNAFRAEMAVLTCSQLKRQYGVDYVCQQENTTLEYAMSSVFAVAGLLSSLILLRAAKGKSSKTAGSA
jgi:hypothetical protein